MTGTRHLNLASFLERNAGSSWVAEVDGVLAGAVLAGHDGRRGFLHHLAVRASSRRQGLARRLVDHALSGLKEAKILKCHIMVFQNNDEGQRFWSHLGWTVRDDLQVLSLELVDASNPCQIPRPAMSEPVTVDVLKEFLDAFNRHDLDSIMEYFADDCVFYMPRGVGPRGDRYIGKKDVRAGLAKRFEGIPNVHYGDDRHWACGNFGVSEWTLTGTSVAGKSLEVRGVDLLELADGKITRKDSFWKIVE